MATKSEGLKSNPTLAKTQDGNIQITFTFPYIDIQKAKKDALEDIAKDVEVPGFRKGNAPVEQVEKKVSQALVIEKSLAKILPQAFAEAIEKFKIKPIIYPKFELIKAKEGEDWQVMALTCELPEINLGDYKKEILGSAKAKTIWTPEKGKPEEKKEKTQEEKEQEAVKALLENIKVNIPKILINAEVDNRLSGLLQRLERLGLTLEGYLSSIGKTPESLRQEYEIQAKNSISIDLILQKVAEEEKVKISQTQIDDVIKASSADKALSEKLNTPEQRRLIESVLKKRAALESLVSLL